MNISEITGIQAQPAKRYHFQPDLNLKLPDTYLGVEIELECVPIDAVVKAKAHSMYWTPKKDGSLRNKSMNFIGQEFVFKEPFFGLDVKAAFDELEKLLHTDNKHNTRIHHSVRTSVHVHVDMRNKTLEDIKRVLYVYMIFEKMLFNYEGTGREHNQFCVPMWKYSTDKLEAVHNSSKSLFEAREFMKSFSKYGAINLAALTQYGSIEFRIMHGMSRSNELYEWVQILTSLVHHALTVENILDLPGNISMAGVDTFVKQVFGEELFEKLNYDRIEMDIYEGIRLAQEFIYCDDIAVNNELNMYIDEADPDNKFKDAFMKRNPGFFNKQVGEPMFFVEVDDLDDVIEGGEA